MSTVDIDPGDDITAEPVPGLGRYTWRTGAWERIFNRQIQAAKDDLARAHAEDRAVVYLSCPISSRGGGWSRTNAEIAHFTARRLMHRWGERLFVLNPAEYQMESREGTGRILQHIRAEWPDGKEPAAFLKELTDQYKPGGGDYMRMWVTVLAEDDLYPDHADGQTPRAGLNCGGMFDAYYFLGPSDVQAFFGADPESSLTQLVEGYFARRFAIDIEFRQAFDPGSGGRPVITDAEWETRRKRFFRYYALRASAAYSLGSHDEWNTLVKLNAARRQSDAYGPGEEIACFFDGRQVSPAAAAYPVSHGYEVPTTQESWAATILKQAAQPSTPLDQPPREIAWPAGTR